MEVVVEVERVVCRGDGAVGGGGGLELAIH